jgi:hypothetical protein
MAEDLVKANDDEFFDQSGMFHDFVNANPAAYGFTADELTELKNKRTTFGTSLDDYNTKQTAARAARQKKDGDRDPCEDQFRWMAGQFNRRPNVTNADRIAAGLPPRAESVGGITPDLGNPPLLLVEQAGIHEHRPKFFMQNEDSNSTKKPQGVDGAKIYMKIGGEASTNLKEYQLIAFDKKSPYSYTHEATDAGKTAHYIAVWATDDDLQSTQSEVFSLTIT